MATKLEENPALFLLYVEWGIGHLALIDDCIKRLMSHHNLNLLDVVSALQNCRTKLCEEEVYKIADRMLTGTRNKKGNFFVKHDDTAVMEEPVSQEQLASDEIRRAEEWKGIVARAMDSFIDAKSQPHNMTPRESISAALHSVKWDMTAWMEKWQHTFTVKL